VREDGVDEGVEGGLGGRGTAPEVGLHAHGARERLDEAAALALQEDDAGEGDARGVDLVGDLADVAAQEGDLGGEGDGVGGAGQRVGVDAEGGVGVVGRRGAARPAAGAGCRRGGVEAADVPHSE
jgi:hypothetical protein